MGAVLYWGDLKRDPEFRELPKKCLGFKGSGIRA